jgi:hypothetical protein
MRKLISLSLILLALFFSLSISSFAFAKEFQKHELTGNIGEASVRLLWHDSRHLSGYMSSPIVDYGEYTWTFSEDFKSIKVHTEISGAKVSYTLKLEGKVYHGLAPSAFGMGQEVKFELYPGKITGIFGADEVSITIDPSLAKGEIPQLDWIFEK